MEGATKIRRSEADASPNRSPEEIAEHDSERALDKPVAAPPEGLLPALQLQKLQLEIVEIRQWWRRPQFISSFFPAIIAVVGLGSAVYVGYFDKARIDLEKSYLQQQINSIESTRTSLEREVESLRAKERALGDHIRDLSAARSEESAYSSRAIGANQELASENAGLRERLSSALSSLEELRAAQSREAGRAGSAKAYTEKLREELSILPPFATRGVLLSSDSDSRIFGGVFGANFEEAIGRIRVRIVRAKLLAGEKAPTDDRVKELLLDLEVDPKFVTEWSWRRLNFYFSPDNRARLVALQKRLGKASNSDPLDLGGSVEFHGQVETAVGKTSEWIVLTAYPPNTPEIR